MSAFNIPASIALDIVQSPIEYNSCFLIFAFAVPCDKQQDLYSQIPCQNFILFSSTLCFLKFHFSYRLEAGASTDAKLIAS
jgi:hypothetical protein